MCGNPDEARDRYFAIWSLGGQKSRGVVERAASDLPAHRYSGHRALLIRYTKKCLDESS
jgi:hypothetical protein